VDDSVGEKCDDGNLKSGDGCSYDCLSLESCGNDIVDEAAGEVCDDGNTQNGDKCSSDCRSGEKCGNGIRDANEQCDDGNASDEDNCLNSCVLAICGDGKVDGVAPRIEQCDTGGESETCNSNCTLRKCGDGIVNPHAGEECEDGNTIDTDGCTNACKWSRCGDGILNAGAGEQCDDGNIENKDGCTNMCRTAWCGDGFVQEGVEECEPGTDDHCNYDCKRNRCGDGIVNARVGEVCDDGNNNTCGTCSANCHQKQDVSRATGSIIAVPRDNLSGPDHFSISDGTKILVFEFDNNDKVEPGRIPIKIQNTEDANDVADVIASVINASDFRVKVSAVHWNVVMLTHEHKGAIGNQPMSEQVIASGFRVEGMSGGFGYDCPANEGCRRNEDCKSGLTCNIPAGQPKGTCQ
jgi:cysteine-rich repeat protein